MTNYFFSYMSSLFGWLLLYNFNLYWPALRLSTEDQSVPQSLNQYLSACLFSANFLICYSTVQYSTVQYSTVRYSTVQYSTVLYSTLQYSTAGGGLYCYCLQGQTLHYKDREVTLEVRVVTSSVWMGQPRTQTSVRGLVGSLFQYLRLVSRQSPFPSPPGSPQLSPPGLPQLSPPGSPQLSPPGSLCKPTFRR